MLEGSKLYSSELINIATQRLSSYFKNTISFAKIIPLSEPGRRNLILRLEVETSDATIPKSFILKQTHFESNDESPHEQLSRFAHDWAGLEFLTMIGGNHAPRFYLGDVENKFIIIEDLGEPHASLVGPLTKISTPDNIEHAETALKSYVHRLGKMHADTAGKYDIYSSILQKIYPESSRYHFFEDKETDVLIKKIKTLIGVESQGLTNEIISIVDFAKIPSEFRVFLHGDICPDNVYYCHEHMQFIDFEFADFGNALLDGTYLRMYMPTCWCSKAVPPATLHKMETIYRDELKKKISAANNDELYKKQLVYSCAHWVLRAIQVIYKANLLEQDFISQTVPLESDAIWDPKTNTSRTRLISKLSAFISCIENENYLPEFKKVSEQLLRHLQKLWSDTRFIDLYPVFESIKE